MCAVVVSVCWVFNPHNAAINRFYSPSLTYRIQFQLCQASCMFHFSNAVDQQGSMSEQGKITFVRLISNLFPQSNRCGNSILPILVIDFVFCFVVLHNVMRTLSTTPLFAQVEEKEAMRGWLVKVKRGSCPRCFPNIHEARWSLNTSEKHTSTLCQMTCYHNLQKCC